MMKRDETLQYKGYTSVVHFDAEDKVLYGVLEGIRDLVTYEAESADDVERQFRMAVDDYLEMCKETNKEPQKPFKGSFNIRIDPEVHRKLFVDAQEQGISLNTLVARILSNYLSANNIIGDINGCSASYSTSVTTKAPKINVYLGGLDVTAKAERKADVK